ncbi:MAG: FecR family protein [Pseudomonas sp.]
MNRSSVSAKVLDEAISWQLCLGSGAASDLEKAEFHLWHAASAEHARAWGQLNGLDQHFAKVSSQPARRALVQAAGNGKSRLRSGGLLGLLLAGVLGLGVAQQHRPLGDWLADEHTAPGEQRDVELPDHTKVRLNSRSALDIDFNAKQRRIFLRSGEILVETAHGDARPFIVATDDGELRALGTRFLVRHEDAGTRLIVLQSAVAAHPADAPPGAEAERIIREGEQVLMAASALGDVRTAPATADAWVHGMLVVENMRLADLLEQLGDYRQGFLNADPAVADLRISGSFPLQNTDLALAALPPSLPVQIQRRAAWWTRVVPAPVAEKP